MSTQSEPTVAILDAGAQYAKVIDRRIRELAVHSVILPLDTPADDLAQYQALIISGGPESVYGAAAPRYDSAIFELDKPILGICYGLQLMVHHFGGKVEKKEIREDGQFEIKIDTAAPIFNGLDSPQTVLLTHGDTVDKVPGGWQEIAWSGELIAGAQSRDGKLVGLQFHPEVDLTIQGQELFKNFVTKIAQLPQDFSVQDRAQQAIEYLRNYIGQRQALILLSGGVDSTVTAALLRQAIPAEQITAIHIDHGLMRLDESKQVVQSLRSLDIPVQLVEAQDQFLKAQLQGQSLASTTDPETKRKVIGDTFITVTQQVISKLELDPSNTVLVQGTLRPDLIESAGKHTSQTAQTIKTHHNDSDLVRQLRDKGQVAEPLAEYHKDEVRQLGQQLGLPDQLVWRQPFPGPGLAIRVICATKPSLQDYTQVFEKLQNLVAEQNNDVAATLLPIQTVGIQGDGRTYSYPAMITGPADWLEAFKLAKLIPQQLHQINRVVYAFGQPFTQPITSITPTTLQQKGVLESLRQADQIVNNVLLEFNLIKTLTQVPVISIPVTFDAANTHSIVIRTFITNDFMTGVPAVPGKDIPVVALQQMVDQISKIQGISRVLYDLTAKPPGTTEWE